MTITEAATLARVNHRSQWLYEQGYRARISSVPAVTPPGEDESAMQIVEVISPEGEAYEVSLPALVLRLAELVCPDLCEECDRDEDWLDLSGELTAYQDEFNLLQIGNCTCPFWRKHNGRYWCKHYLGAPLLMAHERAKRAREIADRMERVTEAMRSGAQLRLCSGHPRPQFFK